MKLLVIGDKSRVEKYTPQADIVDAVDVVVANRGASDAELIELAGDADFILADAISPVSAELMRAMPNLKLVHSEGVATNAIDCSAAKELGIYVCNNAGVNAGAVAEQAILLMLACLRSAIEADAAVRRAEQIQTKERMMVEGITELGDCKIGFIGFGAIGQACAKRLSTWGCEMFYNKHTQLSVEQERELNATFATVDQIAQTCDIISLGVPVTDETYNMINADFLEKVKPGAIIINTARGEVIDQVALAEALESGRVGAAGLDVLAPEPVRADNPLLNLSEDASKRVVFSPHIGGVTEGMFYRAHARVWENIARVAAGEEPTCRVV
jgi:phosphoglycerate dehydrogenase-like enzyme